MTRRKKDEEKTNTTAFIGMIREHLHVAGMEQRDFAARVGIGEDALSRLLSDQTRRPEPETVVGVAREIGKPVWSVAIAAGYPFTTPDTPSADDERLLRLMQTDPGIRKVLDEYWNEISPEKRESVIRLALAILAHDRPESGQSP